MDVGCKLRQLRHERRGRRSIYIGLSRAVSPAGASEARAARHCTVSHTEVPAYCLQLSSGLRLAVFQIPPF